MITIRDKIICWLAFLGSVALFLWNPSNAKSEWYEYTLMVVSFICAILVSLKSFIKAPKGSPLLQDDKDLIEAAVADDLDRVGMLLEKGANPNAAGTGEGSALIYAADSGNVEMVKLLLEYNANVNHQDEVNGNALEVAACVGSAEIVELLIKAGADVNAKSYLGTTALEYALSSGHQDIAEILRRAGATARDN